MGVLELPVCSLILAAVACGDSSTSTTITIDAAGVRTVAARAGDTISLDGLSFRPLVMRDVQTRNFPADVISRIDTGTTHGWLLAGTQAAIVPPELPVADDRHFAQLSEMRDRELRYRAVTLDPAARTPVSLDVPPFLESATLDGGAAPAVTFSAPGDWDRIQVDGSSTMNWLVTTHPGAALRRERRLPSTRRVSRAGTRRGTSMPRRRRRSACIWPATSTVVATRA